MQPQPQQSSGAGRPASGSGGEELHPACGPHAHVARLEFPRETGLILRCTRKVGNPFQTTQGNRLSCRDQEGRRGSDEVVPGKDCSPPGFSVHGILQARKLNWVAMPSSRGSPRTS